MASEPRKTNDNDQPRAARAEVKAEARSTEAASHLEPYPTGSPQDPDGREAFKAAHGYYPEDYPPAHLTPPPEGGEAPPPEEAPASRSWISAKAPDPAKKGK